MTPNMESATTSHPSARQGIISQLSRIHRGYVGFFRKILRLLLFLFLIVLTAAAVAFPLWYWAIHGGGSFTWTVLAVLAASAIYLSGKRLYQSSRTAGRPITVILKRPLLHFFRLIIALLVLYGTAVLFASPQPLLGLPALIGALYLTGVLFFNKNQG